MLNRIYIIVGMLAIILLSGAFLAPFMVDWNSFRERMEFIAQKALGNEVKINGDMSISLLPQPRLSFEDVVVGSDKQIGVKIARVSARFSLLDFFRDRYFITDLSLESAQFFLKIDEGGKLIAPFVLAKSITNINASIADANIENGSIEIYDARVDEVLRAQNFDGNLTIAGLDGPFSLAGIGEYEGKVYDLRVNSSQINSKNKMQLGLLLRPQNNGFTLKMNGELAANLMPEFTGEIDLKIHPLEIKQDKEREKLGVQGDFLFNSKVEISSNEILFREYIIVPDENLPATRLSGAANIDLRNKRKFNAVISGSIISLGFHSAIREAEDRSYAILRFLREFTLPFIPAISGQVGIDMLELDLGEITLRDVRIDARTDGKSWFIDNFSSLLNGKTVFALDGKLSEQNNNPIFNGNFLLEGEQLELFAKDWRNKDKANSFFNIPFSVSGKVQLSEKELLLNDASFIFENIKNDFSLAAGLGSEATLSIIANLGGFSKNQSETLISMLPKIGANSVFASNFSSTAFDLKAKLFALFDFELKNIAALGEFTNEKVDFKNLAGFDLIGSEAKLSGTYNFSQTDPVIFGQGTINQADKSQTAILSFLTERLKMPSNIDLLINNSLPLNLSFKLSKPNNNGGQNLNLNGQTGNGDLDANIELKKGVFNYSNAPINAKIEMKFLNSLALSKQFSLRDIEIFADSSATSPLYLSLKLDGTIMNSVDLNVALEGKNESANFDGNIIISDISNWRGNGEFQINSRDISPLIALAGINGLGAVPAFGSAFIKFKGNEEIIISDINAQINNSLVEGDLLRKTIGKDIELSGSLKTDKIELSNLAILLGGTSSTILGEGVWPIGPFSLLQSKINSRLAIGVKSKAILFDGQDFARDANFEYIIADSDIFIRDFRAKFNGQDVFVDLAICCTGTLTKAQIKGRLSLDRFDIDSFFVDRIADRFNGKITGAVQFLGSGNSYEEIIQSLVGDGSILLEGLEIKKLNSNVFDEIFEHDDFEDMAQSDLEETLIEIINAGDFQASKTNAILSIANGNLRAANVSLQSEKTNIFGSIKINLVDLELDGKWAFTLLNIDHLSKILDKTNAIIRLINSGTLLAPILKYDLSTMIDGVQVRALEIEVDRLEKLRIEAELRSKNAALQRLKLMEEQRRILEEKQKEEEREALLEAERAAEEAAKEAIEQELNNLENNEELEIEQQNLDIEPIDLLNNNFEVPAPNFQ
ncbi:MAG: AsmA family protein [Devosiaceae bacterium]|nr:AsmA family protein [Devosiaceae bacterium]